EESVRSCVEVGDVEVAVRCDGWHGACDYSASHGGGGRGCGRTCRCWAGPGDSRVCRVDLHYCRVHFAGGEDGTEFCEVSIGHVYGVERQVVLVGTDREILLVVQF